MEILRINKFGLKNKSSTININGTKKNFKKIMEIIKQLKFKEDKKSQKEISKFKEKINKDTSYKSTSIDYCYKNKQNKTQISFESLSNTITLIWEHNRITDEEITSILLSNS